MAIDVKTTNGAATPALDLIRAIADRKAQPTPWVDADTFPWRDEDFSARFVRRANYQQLFGMKETGEEVDELAALLGRAPKARVLDLCSGNGRHSIALALRGYRATGIDVGPGAVSLARETSKNLGLSVDFRLLDVRSVAFEDAYDAAFLTCGGFSDFSPSDGASILALAERALAPGGRLVVEYFETARASTTEERSWQYIQAEKSLFFDGPHLQLEERQYDPESSAASSRYFVVLPDGSVREFTRCTQYYTEDAVREMLKAAHLNPERSVEGSAPGLRKIAAAKA